MEGFGRPEAEHERWRVDPSTTVRFWIKLLSSIKWGGTKSTNLAFPIDSSEKSYQWWKDRIQRRQFGHVNRCIFLRRRSSVGGWSMLESKYHSMFHWNSDSNSVDVARVRNDAVHRRHYHGRSIYPDCEAIESASTWPNNEQGMNQGVSCPIQTSSTSAFDVKVHSNRMRSSCCAFNVKTWRRSAVMVTNRKLRRLQYHVHE